MSENSLETEETIYQQIGGEVKLRELVECFYQIMDTNPDYQVIRKMHPDNLETSVEKLFLFLSGWMGGPPLYIQKYGHPRLRARHLPFPIGEDERDQWISCMTEALDKSIENNSYRVFLREQLYKVADFMRNS